MHLLIIDDEIKERSRISCYTDVLNFYLCRELRRQGVKLSFADGGTEEKPALLSQVREWPLDGIDHVLALGLRYFTRTQAASILRSVGFRGAITQMHDGPLFVRNVDCTFTAKYDPSNMSNSNLCVGWAADHDLIQPAQVPGELCILVDHEHYEYGMRPVDYSQAIIASAAEFARSDAWRSRYESVVIRQLVDGGAVYVDMSNPSSGRFNRQHVPFEQMCREYGRASLYMVTHQESVGLTCLETAMAGAYVAVPGNCVSVDRLNTIRHLTYSGAVPWQTLVENIDVAASRQQALHNSWAKLTDKIILYFETYGRLS